LGGKRGAIPGLHVSIDMKEVRLYGVGLTLVKPGIKCHPNEKNLQIIFR